MFGSEVFALETELYYIVQRASLKSKYFISASDDMVAVGRVEEPLINYLIPTQTVNRCLSVLSVDSLFLCPTRTFRFRCPLSKRRHPRTSGWTWSYPPVDDLVRRKGWSQSLSLSLFSYCPKISLTCSLGFSGNDGEDIGRMKFVHFT